jgi:hypothetical protein
MDEREQALQRRVDAVWGNMAASDPTVQRADVEETLREKYGPQVEGVMDEQRKRRADYGDLARRVTEHAASYGETAAFPFVLADILNVRAMLAHIERLTAQLAAREAEAARLTAIETAARAMVECTSGQYRAVLYDALRDALAAPPGDGPGRAGGGEA